MFYLLGWIYDWTLEPLLRKIKQNAARYVFDYDLSPALDVCCGTGVQCHLISRTGKEIIGLDINLGMLKYAAAKYPYLSFIRAQASQIPLKNRSIKGVIISFALHDKRPELREKIFAEARRLLVNEGKIILIDFERPWSLASHLASLFICFIERIAGPEHFRNGRQFIRQGGLREFVKKNRLREIKRHDFELGSSALVVTRFS